LIRTDGVRRIGPQRGADVRARLALFEKPTADTEGHRSGIIGSRQAGTHALVDAERAMTLRDLELDRRTGLTNLATGDEDPPPFLMATDTPPAREIVLGTAKAPQTPRNLPWLESPIVR